MAFPLPPWLQVNPNDFLAAVNSGAQAGIHVAGLRNQAQQSADRLAQATNEASANRAAAADRAAEQIALHSWEAGERLRQQAKELADLSAYREGQLGNRAAQLSLQAVEDARKEAHDAATHQLGRDRLALDERRAKIPHITKSGSDIYAVDATTGETRLLHKGKSKPDPYDYETITEVTPKVSAAPGIPAVTPNWFQKNILREQPIPAVPETLEQPEIRKTRKVKIGTPSSGPSLSESKKLTVEQARAFLNEANGDRAKAEQMAKDAGYDF